MPAAIGQQRINEIVIEGLPESSFGVEPTFTSPLRAAVNSIDPESARPEAIADPAMRIDGGEHPEIVGLVYGANVPMTMKLEGIGAVPADGAAPVHTFQTRLTETVFGKAAELLKRSTVKTATSPTTTSIVETAVDGHKPAAGYGLVPVAIGSSFEVRPYLYTAGTETLALAMALSVAPSVGGILHGGALFQFDRNPTAPPTMAMRCVANDAIQNIGLQGVVAGLEIPETAPNQVPLASYKLRCASSTRHPAGWTRTPATNARGRVFAGSEVLLGKVGATTYTKPTVRRLSAMVRPGWEPIDSIDPASGIAGWGPSSLDAGYIELTVPHNLDPDDVLGGSSYASWLAWWESNGGEEFQIQASFGRMVPGQCRTIYCHRANIKKPVRSAVGSFDCIKLRFVPAPRTAADFAAGTTAEFIGLDW